MTLVVTQHGPPPAFNLARPSSPPHVAAVRLRDGDIATVVAILAQLLEFGLPYPATILKIILTVLFTIPGRSVFLPALLICQFFSSDFLLGDVSTYEYLLERHEAARVTILGFPLTTNYVFAVAMTLRVFHEVISRPETFRGIISTRWLWAWASCFGPALLAVLFGKTEGRFSWTAPIRDVMMVGCLFYGMILARNKTETIAIIMHRLIPLAIGMLSLAMIGYFYSRGMYLVTALGPAFFLTGRTLGQRSQRWTKYAILFGLSLAYTFAFYPTAYAMTVATVLYSTSGNSFALIAIWLVAVIMTILLRSNRISTQTQRKRFTLIPLAAGVMAILLPIVFTFGTYSFSYELPKVRDIYDLPVFDRFMHKLFYDRAPIWRGAIDELCSPPYVIKASGQMGYRLMLNGDKTPWPAGSHNLVLEELRRNGWYSGIICLFLIIRANMFTLAAALQANDATVRSFAIATFSCLFILTLTSHIPMETNAAIWLLGPAGICPYLLRGARAVPLNRMDDKQGLFDTRVSQSHQPSLVTG